MECRYKWDNRKQGVKESQMTNFYQKCVVYVDMKYKAVSILKSQTHDLKRSESEDYRDYF